MGDVVHVNFGADRNWDELRKAVLAEVETTLNANWRDRLDRDSHGLPSVGTRTSV